jgi:methionine synthase II (cobalamin-independent)
VGSGATHEWRVFEGVKLPDDRYLVPGVIDSTNNFVEHPDLVAERLLNYSRLVGAERVMAGPEDTGSRQRRRVATKIAEPRSN